MHKPDGLDRAAQSTVDREVPPPLWRQHFPVETDNETSATRRAFLGGVTVTGGGIAASQLLAERLLGPTPGTEFPPEEATWSDGPVQSLDMRVDQLAVGESALFHYPHPDAPCLLVRLDEERIVAYSQKCTHLACPVIAEVQHGRLHCPCHHGSFDLAQWSPPQRPRPAMPFVESESRWMRTGRCVPRVWKPEPLISKN